MELLNNYKENGALHVATYSFGGQFDPSKEEQSMSLLALSHTAVEHRLYLAMLSETRAAGSRIGAFSIKYLMRLTGLSSYSTIRRGRNGLLSKLSIDCHSLVADGDQKQNQSVYFIFTPEEIFARRRAAGLERFPKEIQPYGRARIFNLAIERVLEHHNLSRRECQVALRCAEGLTNAEIGEKLYISEETVKFHLRHVFAKLGIKRRAELVSYLLAKA